MSNSELTGLVIGAAIEVHKVLGPGLLESIYQKSLGIEFQLRGITVDTRCRVPLRYKGQELGDDLVMDFYFPERLVVEIKSVNQLAPVHTAQILSYMKLSNAPLGLLINFNVPVLKDGIKQLALSSQLVSCLNAKITRRICTSRMAWLRPAGGARRVDSRDAGGTVLRQ